MIPHRRTGVKPGREREAAVDEVEFYEAGEAFYETDKGWAFFPFQAGYAPCSQVDQTSFHTVKSNPGQIRGNHLHPGAEEWLHSFGGPAVFYWRGSDGKVKRREIDDESTIVRIKAGVAHAILNPGPLPTYLVAFRSQPSEPETAHTRPAEVV